MLFRSVITYASAPNEITPSTDFVTTGFYGVQNIDVKGIVKKWRSDTNNGLGIRKVMTGENGRIGFPSSKGSYPEYRPKLTVIYNG